MKKDDFGWKSIFQWHSKDSNKKQKSDVVCFIILIDTEVQEMRG